MLIALPNKVSSNLDLVVERFVPAEADFVFFSLFLDILQDKSFTMTFVP